MAGPLDGIRIIEVASWMFVPSGGSGARRLGRRRHQGRAPRHRRPPAGPRSPPGCCPAAPGGVNFMVEQPNRGKRSVGIDLAHPDGPRGAAAPGRDGRRVPHQLPAAGAPQARHRHRGPAGPQPRHHRGPGLGRRAPGARGPQGRLRRRLVLGPGRGGRHACPSWPSGWPPSQPTPAFGDVMGGLATAGAIAAALVKRERTGEPSVVDVSLLATAMWQISPMVIASKLFGFSKIPQGDRPMSGNPGVGTYRTADDRFISLMLLQSDKHWDDFVERLGVPDMATDPASPTRRRGPTTPPSASPGSTRRSRRQPLAHWKEALADLRRGVEPVPDARRALRRRAGAGQRLPADDDGRQRRRGAARRQPRPVRRAAGRRRAGARARRAHRDRAAGPRLRLGARLAATEGLGGDFPARRCRPASSTSRCSTPTTTCTRPGTR